MCKQKKKTKEEKEGKKKKKTKRNVLQLNVSLNKIEGID